MIRLLTIFMLLLGTTAYADGYGFRTPSGNIYCNGAVEMSEISCTIVSRSSGPALPRPASCTGNWGHTFSLKARGMPRVECDNYTLRPSRYTDIAAYGQTANLGDITCTSERTGLTCRNLDGRGFSLSRASQRAF